MPDWLAVFAGGVAGTAARAGLDEVASAFPAPGLFLSWSTLVVNVAGAFVLGALAAWVAGRLARGDGSSASIRTLKLLVGTGFAGAFTTYGTYIVASVGYGSLNGIAEAMAQSLGLLVLGGASAWTGARVGEWACAPRSVGECGEYGGERGGERGVCSDGGGERGERGDGGGVCDERGGDAR